MIVGYVSLNNMKEIQIVFTEIIQDAGAIDNALKGPWTEDIFSPKPYNESFWKSYNVLLESEKEDQLIKDLEDLEEELKELQK